MFKIAGDGVFENLYYLIWKKDSPFLENKRQYKIPDTIVYRNGGPIAWYFTSQKGDILKKKKSNVNLDNILHEFKKTSSKSGIIAYFIRKKSPNDKEKIEDEDEKACSTIEYFTREKLESFLKKIRRDEFGILQKFIDSYGEYNAMIQAIWSPKICIFTKKVNLKKITDTKYEDYERILTFEGPDFYSRNVPVRGGIIPGKLREVTESIVDHISNISYEKIQIKRMVVYYKVDQDEAVWLLWSSSIRDEKSMKKQKIKTPDNPVIPLNIETFLKTTDNIRLIQTNFLHSAAKIHLDEKCILCEKKINESQLVEVKYKSLLEHDEIQRKIKMVEKLNTGEKDIQHPDQPVSRLLEERKTGKENKGLIPYIIRKLHPKMKNKDYELLKDKEHFLVKTALVCEECFLMMNTGLAGGGSNLYRPLTQSEKNQLVIRSRARKQLKEQEKVDAEEAKELEQKIMKMMRSKSAQKPLGNKKIGKIGIDEQPDEEKIPSLIDIPSLRIKPIETNIDSTNLLFDHLFASNTTTPLNKPLSAFSSKSVARKTGSTYFTSGGKFENKHQSDQGSLRIINDSFQSLNQQTEALVDRILSKNSQKPFRMRTIKSALTNNTSANSRFSLSRPESTKNTFSIPKSAMSKDLTIKQKSKHMKEIIDDDESDDHDLDEILNIDEKFFENKVVKYEDNFKIDEFNDNDEGREDDNDNNDDENENGDGGVGY